MSDVVEDPNEINCNDFFWWAVSDSETIRWWNRGAYDLAVSECKALGFEKWGPLLFVARSRGMRPQHACYPGRTASALWALFDAAGPPREVDLGNPYRHPADGGGYAYPQRWQDRLYEWRCRVRRLVSPDLTAHETSR